MGVSVVSSIYNAPSIYESGQGGGGGGSEKIGGRDYKTVSIGGDTWLAENLDYKFSGCGIGGVSNPGEPHAWYYNDDEATYGIDGVRKCGLLYNWFAVKLLSDNISNLIPGWHVPTTDECNALANNIGGRETAGTLLKASHVSWAGSWAGADVYGFGMLPAGCYTGNYFSDISIIGSLWLINENGGSAYRQGFDSGVSMPPIDYLSKSFALSVRLVKD